MTPSNDAGNIQSNSSAITMKKEKTMLEGPVILFEEPSELPGDRQVVFSSTSVPNNALETILQQESVLFFSENRLEFLPVL